MSLILAPITLREANTFVARCHRHHKPDRGCVFVLSVIDEEDGDLHGVGIVGRPKARMLQDGWTAELTRLCTDGHPNASSMLLGAARRAARALGYRRLVTYTLPEEGGDILQMQGTPLLLATGITPPEQTPPSATYRAEEPALAMFGIGLIQEIPDDDILALADPDDADGDGISGRAGRDMSGLPGVWVFMIGLHES